MSITLKYAVHDAPVRSTHPQTVQFQGEDIRADVPVMEVKLVPTDDPSAHGTQVLRFVGKEINVAEAVFYEGARVNITYDAEPQSQSASGHQLAPQPEPVA